MTPLVERPTAAHGGLLLSIVASLAAYGGFAWLHSVRLAPTPFDLWGDERFGFTALLVGVVVAATYAAGVPDAAPTRLGLVRRTLLAAAVSLTVVSLLQLLWGRPLLPRSVVLGGTAVQVPLQLLVWNLGRDRAGRRASRVALVASAAVRAELEASLPTAEVPADVVLAVDPSTVTSDGTHRPLVEAVERAGATVVVLDSTAQADASIVSQAARLHADGCRIRTVALFSSDHLGRVPLSEVERVSLLFDVAELHRRFYPRAKRLIDLSFCLVGLPLLVLALPLVGIGNLVGNRGPLLFRQERVGKGGEPFTILKFRTMVPGGASHWTTTDDPRITPFGHFLRRSHLDELPQIWNIVRGELSLVGPRPEQVHYVEELTDKLPFYAVRHITRPGLTGWAQVKMGYQADLAGAVEKLQYDLHYLRHQDLRLDLVILARTARSVIGRAGR